MIIGNQDMTCLCQGGGGGDSFQNGQRLYCLYDNMDQMTGYNAKLIFFRFKLIELTPKVIKNGIKISLKVSWRVWAAVSS